MKNPGICFFHVLFAFLASASLWGQNVGINTPNPQRDLHIVTRETPVGGILVAGSDSTRFVGLNLRNRMPDGRRYVLQSIGGTADSLKGKFMLLDGTANRSRLVIDSTGKVGIGVISPTAELDVRGLIKTDSTVLCNTLFSNSLVVQGQSLLNGQLVGTSALFTGQLSAIQGDFILGLSALSGAFTTTVTANEGDFNLISGISGTFNGDVSAQNIALTENVTADSAIVDHLLVKDDFITGEGIFNGPVTASQGILVRDILQMDDESSLIIDGSIKARGTYSYQDPKPYIHHVSALHFEAQGPVVPNTWVKKENYAYLHQAGPDSAFIAAPVNLPDSARVKSLTVYFYDNNSMNRIQESTVSFKGLSKQGIASPTTFFEYIYETQTSDASSDILSALILPPPEGILIENDLKMYYIQASYNLLNSGANDSLRFYGISIEYEVPGITGI